MCRDTFGSSIDVSVNHNYRRTKHRRRLPARVLSWYVLVADRFRPVLSLLTHCGQFQRRVDFDDDDFDI